MNTFIFACNVINAERKQRRAGELDQDVRRCKQQENRMDRSLVEAFLSG
jgi:hypothetical protein